MKDTVVSGAGPLHVSRAAWDAIHAEAEARAPDECCGLLLGDGDRIELAWPARNTADTPRSRYVIDPRDHFAAVRHARARGWTVVGAWHSHPHSAPRPSPTDRAEAFGHFIYLIVGRETGALWTPRAFVLIDGNFEERSLVPEP